MKLCRPLIVICVLMAFTRPAMAIKPLVSGDVPTAPKGVYELFVGYLLVEGDRVRAQEVPFWEVVYGVTERQELTIEAPLIVLDVPIGTEMGIGDAVVGTKFRFFGEPEADSGLSASLEVKLPTGDEERGLGSGATDVSLLTRWGWEIGREVVYFNLGYAWIGERGDKRLDNVWFYSGVWDHPVGQKLRLLTEVYGVTAADPDGPSRLAGTIGVKWKVFPMQQFHFSVGRSLRTGAEGGPNIRLYTGWRWDF